MRNIAIAEDQLLFRKGFINIINSFRDTRVIIEAENGKQLINRMKESPDPVDLTFIDLNMPVINGLDTMKQIRSLFPATKNIILTVHEEEKYIHKLIEEGANAYLTKGAEISEVQKTIDQVLTNDFYFNELALKAMHNYVRSKKKNNTTIDNKGLTSREKEVLLLICKEKSSPDIAKQLFLSESTVNGHRNNLLLKTGCKNTAGLILFAIRNDLFDPKHPEFE